MLPTGIEKLDAPAAAPSPAQGTLTRSFGSLGELLWARAADQPDRVIFELEADDGSIDPLTFDALRAKSCAIAEAIEDAGGRGRRALVVLPSGRLFIEALWGAWACGAIAVPAAPPMPRRAPARLRSIAEDARPNVILTSRALAERLTAEAALGEAARDATIIAIDALSEGRARRRPRGEPKDIAFVQYTSGTTSALPLGCEVPHACALENLDRIAEAFDLSPRDRGAFWLPMHHDMGLVGGVLGAVAAAVPTRFLAPITFARRPIRWLSAISATRATIAGGPDLGFDLCVRRTSADERRALDLSAWRIAFSGSEPVRRSTMRSFTEMFAPQGFRPSTMRPVYGLAEATLLVAGRGSSGADDGPAPSCGVPSQTVKIVDPETRARVADGAIGEVWVSGPCVANGYAGREEETRATFGALTADGDGPFLRTGDLGALVRGELCVVGRRKETIIIGGRNISPHEIEDAARAAHPALDPSACLAFGVRGAATEEVVVAVELLPRATRGADLGALHDEIVRAVRRSVAEEHEISVRAVEVIASGGLPRTTSGKLRRTFYRDVWLREHGGEP